MDSIKKASSGHMGLPLGCAEIGAVLFGQEMCASPLLARASLLFALHARLALPAPQSTAWQRAASA